MIRTIFIIQIACLAAAFINVGVTGANNYSQLGWIGKLSCLLILVGFLIQFVITIAGLFKRK